MTSGEPVNRKVTVGGIEVTCYGAGRMTGVTR